MPGIEPGSRRVNRIAYMFSRFVILSTFVNGKKADRLPDILSEKILKQKFDPTLNGFTPPDCY